MYKVFFIFVVVVIVLSGCGTAPDSKISAYMSFEEEGEYLTLEQQIEADELIKKFNDEAVDYHLWTDYRVSNDEAVLFNERLKDEGITGIFFDVCKDGTLYVSSSWSEASIIADELNALNTNSFSRVMFFIDNCAKNVTGKKVSTYDMSKDIFK